MALYILYFAIFSVLGWILEVVFSAIRRGRFVNRGFNSGPVCPIYGFCIALLRLVLHPIAHTWILLFVASVLLATLIELVSGYVMDKVFHTKWWDYSNNKCNLGGYICLSFSLIWGGFCMLIAKVFFPLIDGLYALISKVVLYPALGVFLLILLLDFLASVAIARGLDKHLKLLSDLSDVLKTGSDRIGKGVYLGTKKVEIIYRRLQEKTPLLYRRIVNAFPTMRTRYNEQLSLLREKWESMRRAHRHKEKAAPRPVPALPLPEDAPDGACTSKPSAEERQALPDAQAAADTAAPSAESNTPTDTPSGGADA